MPDITNRIRATRPTGVVHDLDVHTLRRRAPRRTTVTRLAAGVGTAAAIAVLAATAVGLRTGTPVQIGPAGGPTNEATVSTPSDASSSPSSSPSPSEPASREGEILSRPTPGTPAASTAGGPAAPACATDGDPDGAASVVIGPDVPRPRCLQVLPGQQLRVVNRTDGVGGTGGSGDTVTASLGGFRFRVAPGEHVLLDLPVSNYLEAGVHVFDSTDQRAHASVWVLRSPSASLGQQEALDALVAFAQDPTDTTFGRLPLAAQITIGTTDDETSQDRSAATLQDPAAWRLPDGTSGLDLLAGATEPLVFTIGQRPACGGAMPPAPDDATDLTRLSIQPVIGDDCQSWFAIDLYVDDQGTGDIHSIILDTGAR